MNKLEAEEMRKTYILDTDFAYGWFVRMLNKERVTFEAEILKMVLKEYPVLAQIIRRYYKKEIRSFVN